MNSIELLPAVFMEAVLLLLDVNDIVTCQHVNRNTRRLAKLVDDRVHERHIRSRHLNQMQSQFMKMGYMEGVERGREQLLQDGFNEGFSHGNYIGYQPGYHMGMLAALSLFAWSNDDIIPAADRQSLCDFNDNINSRVIHIGLSATQSASTVKGLVEIRRSKRKGAIATTNDASSTYNQHSHGDHHGHHHHDSPSASSKISSAPSTSRVVDLEGDIDVMAPSTASAPSTITPATPPPVPAPVPVPAGTAGTIPVNIDSLSIKNEAVGRTMGVSSLQLMALYRSLPADIVHTRADDSRFGGEDQVAWELLGDRQQAARSAPSVIDPTTMPNELDDDFM